MFHLCFRHLFAREWGLLTMAILYISLFVMDIYFFISPLLEASEALGKAVFFFGTNYLLILGKCKLLGNFDFSK